MKIGIFYDWDLTMTEEFQEYPIFRKFMNNLKAKYGISKPEDYWKLCEKSEIGISYMEQMIKDAKDVFEGLTNEKMEKEFAGQTKLASGLPEWFPRINAFASEKGIELEHHVISVGISPLIKGTSVFPYLTSLTSGEFLDDEKGITRVKRIVNPFRKVEFLKTICKGTDLHKDISLESYHLFHRNSIVFGDGQSDMDMFRYVHQRGGFAFAVFKKGDKEGFEKLVKISNAKNPPASSVDVIVPRDYSQGSILEYNIMKTMEDMVEAEKSCDMDYDLVHNWALGHIRSKKIVRLVQEHFDSCRFCQNKFYPKIYFS